MSFTFGSASQSCNTIFSGFLYCRFSGENLKLQQCVAGFISDIALLGAAMQPAPRDHRVGFITSLDHSMWFHNPFRADEWMLYEIESPQCGETLI